ncbi:FAD-binding protein [Endozoicomonas numazuensis]|uniref:FAD-binding protein n=1 Tax=Endozoicomonas numazuensis TaxID=1137799 RepID=UPI000689467C|nr:FAD-binding protein [Endozoicomonas numazuensis]
MNRQHRSDQSNDIPQPVKVSSPDDIQWHQEHDVVIVGFGGAGVSAALQAVDNGADVLALDRFFGGGATTLSGGVVYAGGGSQYQKAAGFDDTPEEMFKYLKMEVGDAVQDETLKRFCDQSIDNLQWLADNNVQFAGNVPPEKTSYPGKKFFLYYSGNEGVGSYAEKARPAPRGHRTAGVGMSGNNFYSALQQTALNKGVKVQSQSEAVGLVVNEAGEVLGVEVRCLPEGSEAAKKHKKLSNLATKIHLYARKKAFSLRAQAEKVEHEFGETRFIRAKKGVVLSTGGFVFNKAMVDQYAPVYSKGLQLGATGCNGSGIRLGQSVGGAVDRMEKMSAWRFINPPKGWSQGIVVNKQGERFCNEEVYGAKLGYEMCENQDGKAHVIINKALFKKSIRDVAPWKVWSFQMMPALMAMFMGAKKAKSIEELADKINVPADKLSETISDYSAAARGEKEDFLGKSKGFLAPVDEGPWYALDASIDSKLMPCPVISLGGLKISEETGLVLNEQGKSIKGLYAAGRAAIGVASNLYVSGLSIADCVFSGRRAGQHMTSTQNVESQVKEETVSEPC